MSLGQASHDHTLRMLHDMHVQMCIQYIKPTALTLTYRTHCWTHTPACNAAAQTTALHHCSGWTLALWACVWETTTTMQPCWC